MDEHSHLTKPHRPPSSILICSLYPPPRSESCGGKSTVRWMFEVKENLKNESYYKQTNRPLAVILTGLYSAVSVFSLMYLQYVDTHVTFTIKKQKRTNALILIHIHPCVSAFVSHTYALNSLTFSLSHTHINHAAQKRCRGCNLSGIGLITALRFSCDLCPWAAPAPHTRSHLPPANERNYAA